MSANREQQRERLLDLQFEANRRLLTAAERADYLLDNGVTVEAPDPQPELKPGDAEFAPTMNTIRDAYVWASSGGDPDFNPDRAIAEFDRGLRRHDAEVLEAAAEAAEADADSEDHNETTMRVYRAWSLWLTQRAARFRREATQ
jgi:hypothetical protein